MVWAAGGAAAGRKQETERKPVKQSLKNTVRAGVGSGELGLALDADSSLLSYTEALRYPSTVTRRSRTSQGRGKGTHISDDRHQAIPN